MSFWKKSRLFFFVPLALALLAGLYALLGFRALGLE